MPLYLCPKWKEHEGSGRAHVGERGVLAARRRRLAAVPAAEDGCRLGARAAGRAGGLARQVPPRAGLAEEVPAREQRHVAAERLVADRARRRLRPGRGRGGRRGGTWPGPRRRDRRAAGAGRARGRRLACQGRACAGCARAVQAARGRRGGLRRAGLAAPLWALITGPTKRLPDALDSRGRAVTPPPWRLASPGPAAVGRTQRRRGCRAPGAVARRRRAVGRPGRIVGRVSAGRPGSCRGRFALGPDRHSGGGGGGRRGGQQRRGRRRRVGQGGLAPARRVRRDAGRRRHAGRPGARRRRRARGLGRGRQPRPVPLRLPARSAGDRKRTRQVLGPAPPLPHAALLPSGRPGPWRRQIGPGRLGRRRQLHPWRLWR